MQCFDRSAKPGQCFYTKVGFLVGFDKSVKSEDPVFAIHGYDISGNRRCQQVKMSISRFRRELHPFG